MQISTLAVITISGVLYFLIVVVILHLLRPDYNPLTNFLSDFGVGRYGLLMSSAFITLAAGSFALSLALQQTLEPNNFTMAAFILMNIWSIGTFLAGIFPTDLPGKNTTSGMIHALSSLLAFCAFIGAVFIYSNELTQNTQLLNLYAASLGLAIIIAVVFILMLYTTFFKQSLAGLGQRVFIAAVLAWILLITFNLL